ncbi:MAG: sugar phosphate isomerase/epimerase [Clostridiales bacterium]|nr:sugar phosphate isomerase/epimerase [Clostridiales bacterium]
MNLILSGFSDEIHPNFDTQLEVASSYGVKAIEIRGVDGKNISTLTPAEAETLKAKLDAKGMIVSSIGSPIGKIKITDDFDAHFETYKNVVELCKVLGSKYIRMFSFFVAGEEAAAHEEEVMKRLEKMAEYAVKQNVVLLHENEKGIFGDIAPRCEKIMKRLYSENFKAVFDFANFVQCGQDTLEAYELMKPYIEYIHIKDAMKGTGKVVPAGWGNGNVKAILSMLKEKGYKGFLSLEPHLTNFNGFKDLENSDGEDKAQMEGAVAYRTALNALEALLWEIDWH